MSTLYFFVDNLLAYYTVTGAGVVVHELGHLFASKLLGGTLTSFRVNPLTGFGNCTCSFRRSLCNWEKLLLEVCGPLFGIAYSLLMLRNFQGCAGVTIYSSGFFVNQISNLLPFEDTTDYIQLWDCIHHVTGNKFGPWKIYPYSYLFAIIGSLVVAYYNL